jgi:hypothetical protein
MKHREIAQYVLAFVIVTGFFSVLLAMLTSKINPETQGALILVGALAAAFGAVWQYYFGSSASSARKDELIARAPPIVE